jgi:hypothetical protein
VSGSVRGAGLVLWGRVVCASVYPGLHLVRAFRLVPDAHAVVKGRGRFKPRNVFRRIMGPFDIAWEFLKADPESRVDVVGLQEKYPRYGGKKVHPKVGTQTAHPAFSPETLAQGAMVMERDQDDSGTPGMHRTWEQFHDHAVPKDEYKGLGQSLTDYQRQASAEGNTPRMSWWDRVKQAPQRMGLNSDYHHDARIMDDVLWAQGGPRSDYHSYPEPLQWGPIMHDRERQQEKIDRLTQNRETRQDLDWAPANQANVQALGQQPAGWDSGYDAQMANYPQY